MTDRISPPNTQSFRNTIRGIDNALRSALPKNIGLSSKSQHDHLMASLDHLYRAADYLDQEAKANASKK